MEAREDRRQRIQDLLIAAGQNIRILIRGAKLDPALAMGKNWLEQPRTGGAFK